MKQIAIILLTAALLVACSHRPANRQGNKPSATAAHETVDGLSETVDGLSETVDGLSETVDGFSETVDGLAVPEIPAMLTAPGERAKYLACHFWDSMDFTDHRLSLDTAFMEQNFANFLSVLPAVDTQAAVAEAVTALLDKATADSAAASFLLEVMEKYLREPNSPMRNEDLFIVFCRQTLKADGMAQWNKDRIGWMLKEAMKNRPGTTAANFAYIDSDNRRNTLHGTKVGDFLLLIFHDPECEHCGEILGAMSGNGVLRQMADDGILTVLAVNVESEKEVWNRTKNNLPAWWVSAYDSKGMILDKQLYSLPAYPVLYLLDRQKKVILKDATPEITVGYLFSNGRRKI